jgi:hypothetical protein
MLHKRTGVLGRDGSVPPWSYLAVHDPQEPQIRAPQITRFMPREMLQQQLAAQQAGHTHQSTA